MLIFFIVENTGNLVVTQDGAVIISAQHGSLRNIKGLNELIGGTIQLDDLFAAGYVLKVVKDIERSGYLCGLILAPGTSPSR